MASLLRCGRFWGPFRRFSTELFVPKADCPTVSAIAPEVTTYLKEMASRTFSPSDYEKPLEPRTAADSQVQFVIPLSTDTRMQSYYLSALGHVRTGKLLEDLDLTAAYLALSHNRRDVSQKGLGVGTLPRIAVTASVERIDFFKHELHPLKDIIIEGRVTYAGRTTVETTLRVYQNDDTGHVQQVLKAHFIMAARCPTRKSGVRVHPLIASTTEEAARISDAEERVKERRKEKQHSLEVTNPTHEEFCQLHQNFLDSVKRKRENMHELTLHNDRQIWQHETQCTTFVNCHPVHQNFYGAVFGGFLMREAAELAQLTAKVFCKGRVHNVSMDDVNFLKGIQVGSAIKFTSTVVFTKDKYLQVRVLAEVVDKVTFEKNISNVFHFTYEEARGQPVKEVVPKHYEHGVLWLEGRRQLEKTLGKFGIQ